MYCHTQIASKKSDHSKKSLVLCENCQESRSFLPVDGEISISRNTARPSLASASKTDEPQNGSTYLFGPCAYSSFLPSPVRVILFFYRPRKPLYRHSDLFP